MKSGLNQVKIAFITTVDRNPGDAFIRAGIEYLIQQIIPYYESIYIDKHDYQFQSASKRIAQSFINKLRPSRKLSHPVQQHRIRDADLVIQAGAPFYYIVPDQNGAYGAASSSITTDWIGEVWLKDLLEDHNKPQLLNLAVGTCQPFASDASEFRHSPALLEFIKNTVERSTLTTVREKVAARLLESLGLETNCLPCTAIFAADRHRIYPEPGQFICLNYMHGGAHYNLGQKIDFEAWEDAFRSVYGALSRLHPVIVMCHSPSEVVRIRTLIPSADTFFSTNYVDYLKMYAKARFGVLNRVHGAIALAGMGRPSVIIGNDTRALMGELLELPTYFVNDARAETILEHCSNFESENAAWSHRLYEIKKASRMAYLQLLGKSLGNLLGKIRSAPGYQRSDSDKLRKK